MRARSLPSLLLQGRSTLPLVHFVVGASLSLVLWMALAGLMFLLERP
jgi:hypothetical protein